MKMDSFCEGRRNSNALPSSSYLAVLPTRYLQDSLVVPPSVQQGAWAAMSVQSKTTALFLKKKRFPSSLSPIESHEQDTKYKEKSLKFFTDAFYLLAA